MRTLDSDNPRSRILSYGPIVLLLSVAMGHFVLVRTDHLSQWKGAGFGMFATTDGGSSRCIHVFALTPDGVSTELKLPSTLADLERRARELPTEGRLKEIARQMIESNREGLANAASVRVEVWRTVFDKETMRPAGELMRSVDVKTEGLKR